MTNAPLHSDRNDIGNTDWLFDRFLNDPNISGDIQQVLARILAIDSVNGIWRSLQSDQQGRLYVTNANVQGAIPSISSVAVPSNTEFSLLSQNNNRRCYLINNISGVTVRIYFSSGSNKTIPLFPGMFYFDDIYVGAVYGISSFAGGSVNVVEY